MSNKSMDEILETYVPSCMDKVLDHYEKQCKKMSSPSEEYKNNMEKLIRREKMRQLYHIPIQTTRRIAAVLVISLLVGMMASMSVEAVWEKMYDIISTVYKGYTSHEYKLKSGKEGRFIPSYPSVIPQGYKQQNEDLGEKWLIQEFYNSKTEKTIVLDEEWLEDGTRIYEDNEFISTDGIVIIWEQNNCKFILSSDEMQKDLLMKMARSMKIKER